MDDGFTIDLNLISKRDFRFWFQGRDTAPDKDLWDAEHLYVKVVVEWPFDAPISVEGYDDLGVLDAAKVDAAVSEHLIAIGKKKSGM